jgi:hypothetical protein
MHEPNDLCGQVESYFDGDLADSATEDFARHLESCDSCRREVAEVQRIKSAIQESFETPLPDEADLRIRRTIHETLGISESPRDEILTLEQVATILHVSLPEVVTMLDRLPAFELAGRIRIRRDRLMEWIHGQEEKLAWEKQELAEGDSGGKIIRFRQRSAS